MAKRVYRPEYAESWALIVGVNRYRYVPPLSYACNDARAVADVLKDSFGFPEDHVTLLLDDDADRDTIRRTFLAFDDKRVGPDDRLLVFYAGHGHTQLGNRGEVGFLVPVDARIDDLSSRAR